MRDKELLQDYRYMPEPNLPPLRLFDSESGEVVPSGQVDIGQLRRSMPELPSARRARYMQTLQVKPAQAVTLVADEVLGHFFERTLPIVQRLCDATAQDVANVLTNPYLGALHTLNQTTEER